MGKSNLRKKSELKNEACNVNVVCNGELQTPCYLSTQNRCTLSHYTSVSKVCNVCREIHKSHYRASCVIALRLEYSCLSVTAVSVITLCYFSCSVPLNNSHTYTYNKTDGETEGGVAKKTLLKHFLLQNISKTRALGFKANTKPENIENNASIRTPDPYANQFKNHTPIITRVQILFTLNLLINLCEENVKIITYVQCCHIY